MTAARQPVRFRCLIGSRSGRDHLDSDWQEFFPAAESGEVAAAVSKGREHQADALQLAGHGQAPGRHIFQMPENTGRVCLEFMQLATGIHVGRAFYGFAAAGLEPLDLLAESFGELPEPCLVLLMVRGGLAEFHNRRIDHRVSLGYGQCYSQFTQRLDQSNRIRITESVEVTSLFIAEQSLVHLLGAPSTELLLDGLGFDHACAANPRRISAVLQSTLQDSLSVPPAGCPQILNAQAKVLNFMVGLAGLVASPLQTGLRKRRVAHAIKNELDRSVECLISLEDLATRYGVSQRTLTAEFRREFGISIFEYARDRRLHAAHSALLKGGLSLKAIALELGYSSSHHLSNAFVRKFGYRPSKLRS
jgi:AraC-like DNA-binding protein